MIEQIIIECLLGGLTGYITNDIALKQLFRDGGIVEKEKDEFIEALVDMVQNEVFTKAQIVQILAKPEVKKEVNHLVERFFEESLENAFLGVKLKDFPHHKEAQLALVCYLNDQEGQHDSLINIEGIYKNAIALIETGALSEVIDTLLSHFATESLKEVIGTGRYEAHVKTRLASLLEVSKDSIGQKLTELSERLFRSEVKIADYLMLSSDEVSESFIKALRQFFNNDRLDKYLSVLEAPQENGANTVFLAGDAFLDKLLAQVTDLFLGHLSTKEEALSQMIKDAAKEATEDLGSGIQGSIVGALESFLSPNWLRKESLGLIKNHTIKDKLIEYLPELKAKGLVYLFSEVFELKVKAYFKGIWNEPLSTVIKRCRESSLMSSSFHMAVSFGLESLEQFSKSRGFLDKLENTPLGLWFLTPKVRREIKEKALSVLAHLASGALDETIDGLEKEYGWKKRLNEQLVDIFANQDLGKIYQLIGDTKTKRAWIESMSCQVNQFLEAHLGEMIARVTKSYLQGLEQKEIRQLVNALLGKEMRPLSLLGGVIGFITGFGLGLFSSEANLEDMALVEIGTRSLTYGAIGYGTNVLAVRSLFKPYRPILGWQGLLPKNKHRFARKMGYMTERYIADEAVWKGYLSKFESSFDDKLDNGFSYLSGLGLLSGKDTIRLTGEWLNRPLSDFVKDRLGHGLSNLLDEGVKIILSDARFKNGFEGLVKRRLIPHFANHFNYYSEKTGTYLWETFKDKGIAQLDKELLVYLDTYFDKGFYYLEHLGEAGILEKLDRLFRRVKLSNNLLFYENLIARIMPFYDKLPSICQTYEKAIAKLLIGKIKTNLGFRAGLAYRMMGGDRYVLRALKLFLYEKLPLFLKDEKEAFETLVIDYIKTHFMDKCLHDFGLSKDNAQIKLFVAQLFESKEKERLKLSLILHVKEKVITPLKTLAESKGVFSENLSNYINLPRVLKEGEKSLLPKLERFLLALQDEVLSYVLTSHINSLFPDWAKNIARMIGQWEVHSMLNVDRLSHIEAVLNGKGVLPDNRFKLAIETYMYDASKFLLPELSKLFIAQTKPLLQAFDFSSVATYAIDKKDARALEVMIRQIANPYFKRVEKMGFLGALVALPSSVLSRLFL